MIECDFKPITCLRFFDIIKKMIEMFEKVHYFLTSIIELPDRFNQFFRSPKSGSFQGSAYRQPVRLKSPFERTTIIHVSVDSEFLRCTQQMVSHSKSCDILSTQDLLHRALSDPPVKETIFDHF